MMITFERVNKTGKSSADFHNMVRREYRRSIQVYADYKTAMAEVKRLNAAEREKQAENDA